MDSWNSTILYEDTSFQMLHNKQAYTDVILTTVVPHLSMFTDQILRFL